MFLKVTRHFNLENLIVIMMRLLSKSQTDLNGAPHYAAAEIKANSIFRILGRKRT